MESTMILEPINHNEIKNLNYLKNKYKKIFEFSKEQGAGLEMTFHKFLEKIQTNRSIYIICLQIQLKRPQIFLKRTISNIDTNAFNKSISNLWFANTDIQFILDPYAAATYCTSYMTKVDKNITSELQSIIQKCINNNVLADERILKLRNAILNAQQMSTQVAIYLILFLPLYHASRTFKFINTSAPQDRAFVLKPQHMLLKLEPESTDIMCKSIIDKYIEIPHSLENVCLAKYESNYNFSSKQIKKYQK